VHLATVQSQPASVGQPHARVRAIALSRPERYRYKVDAPPPGMSFIIRIASVVAEITAPVPLNATTRRRS
jgi:hypothetical protein